MNKAQTARAYWFAQCVNMIKITRGIKAHQVADLMHIGKTYLSKLVNGNTPASDDMVKALQKVAADQGVILPELHETQQQRLGLIRTASNTPLASAEAAAEYEMPVILNIRVTLLRGKVQNIVATT